VVVLAESEGFNLDARHQVTVALPTTNNEWKITVAYCNTGRRIAWYPWAVCGITLVSFVVSALVYTLFSQKQLHTDAIAEQQQCLVDNAKKAATVERELNDFIAHEVRNPLSAALSACSFVSASVHEREPLQDRQSIESVREDINIIESSLQFVNDLLRSMLDLHRARNKQLALEYMPTDIKHDILDPVASMLYRRDDLFQVYVDCPENLVVSVDRLRLKQIVLNLARNSAKFVATGFVRLRAEFDDIEDGQLSIFVEDSGPGIPDDKKDKLFARFQQSLDELSQGTGIGLSLCKKLIDLMDGAIELDESYHSGIADQPGAKFRIQIPCEFIADDIQPLPPSNLDLEAGNSLSTTTTLTRSNSEQQLFASQNDSGEIAYLPEELSLLFADDDMILRKLFARTIRRIQPKWKVQEAANGETVLMMVDQPDNKYDVIFIDQYMTSVDKQLLGTETVRMLRSKGVTTLICGLSANDMEAPFIAAGANTFMIKPFPCKPEPFTQELLRVLNKKPFVY
jgi:signal transduction histidine kinase/CheY-like chemotaxis protein